MTKHKLYKHSFIGWRAYSVVHVNTTACNFNMKSLNDIQNNCTPSLYFCFASNKKGSLHISRSEYISDFFLMKMSSFSSISLSFFSHRNILSINYYYKFLTLILIFKDFETFSIFVSHIS